MPIVLLLAIFLPELAMAAAGEIAVKGAPHETLDLTTSGVGISAIIVFLLAYLLVMAEEFTHLRKSKPVIIAAGVIWAMIGVVYANHGMSELAETAVRHNLLECAELMLFLLVAMTYINAMDERQVFDALRSWLISKGFGFRALFWMTGFLAFFISPIADNLTTALLMCAVVMAVGGDNRKFVSLGCINIVVAANANIAVGVLSAIVDNIPVMFAVLTMQPDMNHSQWLLVILTAGVGGSMLSIGSAAGVALMGQARGVYTFFSHLKWTPVIALGYIASIYVHMLINFE